MSVFNQTYIKKFSLVLFFGVLCLASISPLHYPSYLTHQIGTVLMLGVLFWADRRLSISHLAFVSYLGFLAIHVIASHWLYSYVPYNEWYIALFSVDINQLFGFNRNMFDRVVHFAYGFLVYPIIFELLSHYFDPLPTHKKHLISLGFVMASSMAYELIEWWIALVLSSEHAENYNGQQGDIWDAHKDMFLATVASILSITMRFFKKK